jgi:ribonucleoside-diphosphate reductase alpha chain
LPSDYTFDDFKNVYMSAWDSNIKGITTYREGTMTAVLESQGNSKQNKKIQADGVLVDTSAPKRPKDLDAEVHHVKISGENWTIFVGLQDGRPREVFGGVSENIQLPKKIKNGILSRTGKVDGRGIYSFITGTGEDQIIVKDIVKSFANSDYAFHTLAVSGMLRHGMPIHYILDILHKTYEDSDLYSFNKVLSRVLKKHIKDGTVIRGKCINCASENIVYQEGCMVCRDCGSSKCS